MDENLLRWVLLITYGPFALMLVVFIVALVAKWCGDPSLLQWLVQKTGPQQPVNREH